MKKRLVSILCMAFLSVFSYALDLEIGIDLGLRNMFDRDIRDVYGGTEFVYCPYVSARITDCFSLGCAYEGSLVSRGTIGMYEEEATLKMSGFELFLGYHLKLKKWIPYARLGLGFYHYSQEVESEYGQEIDDTKTAFNLAAGVQYRLSDRVTAQAGLKYVPLTVAPLDVEVDLGGVRVTLGICYRLKL